MYAGAVAAADAELARINRDRDAKAKQHTTELAAIAAELADLGKKLEPLEKAAAAAKKRASELRDALASLDKKIAATEASLVSVKGDKDPAAIQAELATLRADRVAVARDEPVIAEELDEITPRIAALDAARVDARARQTSRESAEADDKRRTAEVLDAIGAKRKVVERAASEAEASRDQALFDLADRLSVDRPAHLAAQLAPIDQIDLELGEADRRAMELKEIVSSVDRMKLARGAAWIALALAVVGGITGWLLYLLA